MDTNCESCWKKIVGKPYSGKPNVRFDEGELEIGLSATTPVLYSTHVYGGIIDSYRYRLSHYALLHKL